MREFTKSSKLDHVLYDVRGPVVEEAARLEEEGVELLCGHTVMVGGPPGPPGEFFYLKDPDGIPLEHLFLPF